MRALLFLLLLVPGFAAATAQIPDLIVLDGKTNSLFTNPFGAYLRRNQEAIPKLEAVVEGGCSASWRGYRANWEIKERRLFLAALFSDPCSQSPKPIPLTTFFPDAQGPVEATWFSGTLVIPQGEMTEYIHMGYQSEYERYLLITVEQGAVVTIEERDSLSPSQP